MNQNQNYMYKVHTIIWRFYINVAGIFATVSIACKAFRIHKSVKANKNTFDIVMINLVFVIITNK